ncbi:T9SS type A sorting domain-containing protein [Flavobacterium rhizosphaerae]|uniref:T9SS type A sorting domain-containing protein n=1 Tax=Flavobacterium rhizosphaerae TaxID=3163298 RepID=A0ABW8Z1U7_9FLAO
MKRIIFKSITLAVLLLLGAANTYAQQARVFGRVADVNPENGIIRCATNQYEEYLQEKYPKRETREEFEVWLQDKIQKRRGQKLNGQSDDGVYVIPVVVHVIHDGDPVGVNENISDAQVMAQIEVLNQDYRRAFGTPGYNNNVVGADIGIEFCLAQVDPYGDPTNGIDRVNLEEAIWPNEEIIDSQVKPDTQWNPNQYFNIWVVNFGNNSQLLGYAQFPNSSNLNDLPNYMGPASTDGVVIGYKYFGSSSLAGGNYAAPFDKGRTATHEIGHCFGLYHTWGNSNTSNCNVNAADSFKDYCPDTPVSAEANYGCSPNDSCPLSLGSDMIQNYMDYTNDACMNIFTQDQKERILTVLQYAQRRASLLNSNVCQPVAGREDFELLNGINVYPNPAQDLLNISVSNGELPDSYVIYNSLGQVMANVKVETTSNLGVNTASYSNGLYFIKISKGSQTKTIKFIKN